MSTPWIIAFIALSVAVVILAAFVIGISPRIITALDHASSHSTPSDGHASQDLLTDSSGPPVGSATPPLPSFDRSATATLTRGAGRRLVVFMEEGCEPCAVLAADLRRKRLRESDVELIAIIDDLRFGSQLPDEWSLIVDGAHRISQEWGIWAKPQAVLTTEDGAVLQTAIPNTRRDVIALLQQAQRSTDQQPKATITNDRHRDARGTRT